MTESDIRKFTKLHRPLGYPLAWWWCFDDLSEQPEDLPRTVFDLLEAGIVLEDCAHSYHDTELAFLDVLQALRQL